MTTLKLHHENSLRMPRPYKVNGATNRTPASTEATVDQVCTVGRGFQEKKMGWLARGCLLETPWLCDVHYCPIKAEIPSDFTHLESTMLDAPRSIGCDCILNLIMDKLN